jgi:hypothetical protein
MAFEGGCRCGAVRYTADVTEPEHHAICHCADCRASSGAPMMAWLAVPEGSFRVIAGEATRYESSPGVERFFCGACGTGLYYRNPEMLPGIIDIQSTTLDDDATLAPEAQIQTAERLPWVAQLDALPAFDRYPG